MRAPAKLALIAAFLCAACAPGAATAQRPDAPRITPDEAHRYVGKFCIVEGRIVEVSWQRRATFLNYQPYRRGSRDFYLVIVGRDRERFDRREVESWEGKVLRVYGRIELYRGRPQIRLRDPDQVEVIDGPRPRGPRRGGLHDERPRQRSLKDHVVIKFLGGAREIGSSAILVSNGRTTVLLDYGAPYGEQQRRRAAKGPEFDPDTLDAVILSHAHLDHIGRIPELVAAGYDGRFYATRVTGNLARTMLEMAADFDDRPAHQVPVAHVIRRFVPEDYHEEFLVADDVEVTFLDAGHIPGSAVTVLEMSTADGPVRIAYTGDYGNGLSPLLRRPEKVHEADVLIIEATYGGRVRKRAIGGVDAVFEPFVRDLAAAVRAGKRVIIPAFVLDRTQKLLWVIGRARRRGILPRNVPVYVTSRRAREITERYAMFWHRRDQFAQYFSQRWLTQDHPFFGLRYRAAPRGDDGPPPRPSIVIASSADGRHAASRALIERLAGDRHTAFFIVGYAPPETPVGQLAAIATGRRPERWIKVDGRSLMVQADVRKYSMFSAHADREQMVEFVTACRNWRHVFVVHGEKRSCLALVDRIREEFPQRADRVVAPRRLESFRVEPAPVRPRAALRP